MYNYLFTALILFQVLISGVAFSVLYKKALFVAQTTKNSDMKAYIYIGFLIVFLFILVLMCFLIEPVLHPVTQGMCRTLN
jgi:hypothetical protein